MRIVVSAVAAVVWAGAALAAEPAAGLAAELDGLSSFRLAEGGQPMKDATLKLEHLEVSIGEGTAVPILAKDGRVAGLYFAGTGGWSYRASDATERAVLKTNTDRVAPGLRSSPDGVGDYFKEMLAIFSEPLWAPPSDGPAVAPPPGAARAFDDAVRLALSSYPEMDFRIAQARLNARGRFGYVEFGGGAERIAYRIDEPGMCVETLYAFRKYGDFKVRIPETISRNQFGDRCPNVVGASIKHADFDVATADNKRGTIASDLDVHVRAWPGARLLHFELMNGNDPDSVEWNSPKNRLEVRRVVDAAGHDLPYAHRYHELLVEVPPLAAAEADVRLRVETEGEIFLDWNGYHADNIFALLGGWYPAPVTNWISELGSYTLKVRTKKPWRAVTSGHQTSAKETEGGFEIDSKEDRPSRYVGIVAGKYITREEQIDGRAIRVHAYAMARKNVLDNMPKLAGGMLKLYSEMLGPIGDTEIEIAEVPEYGFAMAPAGIALLTTEAYKPQYEFASAYVGGINSRLAHELAHQWFGHKAVPATPADNWLAESLAEYYSGIAMGVMQGDKKGIVGFPEMLASWRGYAPTCDAAGPIAGANQLGGEHAYGDRICLLYSRGPLVLHMLRTLVGNDRFLAGTKAYLEKANYGLAGADDFAKAFTGVVRADMQWFVDDWIRQGGTPDVKVDHKIVQAGNGLRLTGTVTESGAGGFKRFYLPLVLDYGGGRSEVRLVFVDKPQTAFDLPLDVGPKGVHVDPGRNNLVKYR